MLTNYEELEIREKVRGPLAAGREKIWRELAGNQEFPEAFRSSPLLTPTAADREQKTRPLRPGRPLPPALQATADFIAAKNPRPATKVMDRTIPRPQQQPAEPGHIQPTSAHKPRRFQSVVRRAFKANVRFPSLAGARKATAESPTANVYTLESRGASASTAAQGPQSRYAKPLPPIPFNAFELQRWTPPTSTSEPPPRDLGRTQHANLSPRTAYKLWSRSKATNHASSDPFVDKPLPARPTGEDTTARTPPSARLHDNSANTTYSLTPTPTYYSSITPPSYRTTVATSRHSRSSSFGCADGLRNPERSHEDSPSRVSNTQGVKQKLRKIASRVHLSKDPRN